MKKISLIISLLSISASLYSCKSTNQVTTTSTGIVETTTAQQTDVAIHQVIYGKWNVTSVNGVNIDPNDEPLYVEFGNDGTNPYLAKCYCYDGCNYLNGEYAITEGGSMKRSGEIISTMKMCPDAKYEMGITLALNNVAKYQISKIGDSYIMTLFNTQGAPLMKLSKAGNNIFSGTLYVKTIYGKSIPNAVNPSLVIDIENSSVHGEVGCNTMNGKVITNSANSSIKFSNLITTRMTCPYIETEQTIIKALNETTSYTTSQENTINFLNSTGATIMSLSNK